MKKYLFALSFLTLFVTFSNHASAWSEFKIYDVKLFLDESKPYSIGDTIDCFVYYEAVADYQLYISSINHNVIIIENEDTNDAQDSMCIFETTWNLYERAVYFQIILKENISDELTLDITTGKPPFSRAYSSIPLNYDSLTSKFEIISSGTKDFIKNGEEVNYEVRFHFYKPEMINDNWQCEYMAYDKFPELEKTGMVNTQISKVNDSVLVSYITIPKGSELICRLVNYDSITTTYLISEFLPNTLNVVFDDFIHSAGFKIDKQTPYFYITNFIWSRQYYESKPSKKIVLIGKDENGNELDFIASTHSIQHRNDSYHGFSYNFIKDKNIINFTKDIKEIDNLVNAEEDLGIFIIPADTNYFPGFVTKDGQLEMEYALRDGENDSNVTYSSIPENAIYTYAELPDTLVFQFIPKVKTICDYFIKGYVAGVIIDKINSKEELGWPPSFPHWPPTELPHLESHYLITLRDTNFKIIDFTFTDNEGNFIFSNLCKGTYYLTPFEPFMFPVSVQKVVLEEYFNPDYKIELDLMSALRVNEQLEYIPFAMSVYPNPSSKKLSVNYNENYIFNHYEIFDLSGNRIQNGLLLNNEIPIDTLINGAYIIVLKNDKLMISTKFVKE